MTNRITNLFQPGSDEERAYQAVCTVGWGLTVPSNGPSDDLYFGRCEQASRIMGQNIDDFLYRMPLN